MPKKEELLSDIKKYMEQLNATDVFNILKIKLPEVPEGAIVLKHEDLLEAHSFVKLLHDKYYADIITIYRLLDPSIWKRYFTWQGFEEHREVILIREAALAFKNRLKARPLLFRKTEANGQIKKITKQSKRADCKASQETDKN